MSDLVGDILKLSKLDSGLIVGNFQSNDLREVLYEIIDGHLLVAQEKSIKLIFDLPDPIMLRYDEELMYSVLSNMIINGIRYARSYIKIDIESNEKELIINISNDGDMIDLGEIEHLFDCFYVGDNGQSGIGLSLSKEYVPLHQGQIKVTSDERVTEFSVILPFI